MGSQVQILQLDKNEEAGEVPEEPRAERLLWRKQNCGRTA
jgi:hypothetical protein